MIGATITRTGTPAEESSRIAFSRIAGGLVRGSSIPRQLGIQRRDRKIHHAHPTVRMRRKQIEIAQHQRVLRDNAKRLPRFDQHFDAACA